MASKNWTESCIINTTFKKTEGSYFLMHLTNKEKLKMCEQHIIEGKSLSHICERYNYKDVSRLKYWRFNMHCIKKSQAEEYSGDGYSGRDYPMTDSDINFATIKINL